MTADIRTAAQRRKFASIEEMMNDPDQRAVEVKVAHRYGYWMIDSGDQIDTDEIAEADAYLEAHIQYRISEARVTPTREQIAEELRQHILLGNIEWDGYTAVCACGWSSEEYKMPGEAHEAHSEHSAANVLALMQGLAEVEMIET